MNRTEIQNRLKAIADEMQALTNVEGDLSDEQDSQYLALESESERLTEQLAEIRASDEREERRIKAQEIRNFATASTRATTPNKSPHIGKIRDSIADDPKRGFATFAHFAQQVFDAGGSVRSDPALMRVAAGTGMSQSVNNDGGVLVPPAFSTAIWDRVRMKSNSLLQYCDRIAVDPGNESVTFPAIAESSRANGSRWGGVQGYWKSELTAMTSSQMKFRDVKLSPHELYVFLYVSDKLLRNAPGTASQYMEQSAADEIAFKIGDSIINGDGTGKPVGVIGHAATVSVAKESGQAAASIQYKNLSNMWARCHMNYRSSAVWFVNQDVETALREMTMPVGTGGVPVYLPPGGASDSPYSRLFGREVVPIEYCPTLGTVGDIILANLEAYAVGIKGMMNAAYSMHLKFDYAQTCYRVIFEIDGQPWLDSAITPFKGSNTLSPIVTLATRS